MLHEEITSSVIAAYYIVYNTLGYGFLEKVYENALALELRKAGLEVAQQSGIQVRYDGAVVGDFVADLLIEEKVLIELKAVKALEKISEGEAWIERSTMVSLLTELAHRNETAELDGDAARIAALTEREKQVANRLLEAQHPYYLVERR